MINYQKNLFNGAFLLLLSLMLTSKASTYTPQNSVIAFDLHDVVADFSPKKAYASFCKLKNKGQFIGNILDYLFTSTEKRKCVESYVLDNNANTSNILEVLNPHVPNSAVIEIIQELKALGYQIYLCSNLGEQSYEYMRNLYPEVFSLFNGYYISSAASGYIKKNNPQFFVETAQLIDQQSGFTPEKIIFIDNNRANLKLATSTEPRFIGLFFKNSRQIRQKLKHLNLGF